MRMLHRFTVALFIATNCTLYGQNTPSTSAPTPPSPVLASNSLATQPTLVLQSPAGAQTAGSIALLWEKPTGLAVEGYDIYSAGNLVASTKNTDFTLQNLAAGKEYEISVRARLAEGLFLQSNTVRIATKPEPQTFDIMKYRAAGDGKTLNTAAIQAAIDACTPGGMVLLPKGTFLSGALYVKSDMTLFLAEGATLLGSTETKDYPVMKYRFEGREQNCYASLINTRPIQGTRWRNITLAGTGTIDANGSALRKKEVAEAAGNRGRAVCIRDTDNVYLQGITVRQSPAWCVHPIYCKNVTLNGVNIQTKYDEAGNRYSGIVNGDGLDPDSCQNVFIFDCTIASQDDCIAIKSGRDAEGRTVGIPSEKIRISHCRFNSGFGVAMGSEMSGGVRNVLVEDCVFNDAFSIASVKAPRGRGSVIENITYRDCTLTNKSPDPKDGQWFRGAIYVDQFYGVAKFDPYEAKPKDDGTPIIRNITFQNITLDTVGGNAIYLTGLAESPLENIRFENVAGTGVHGFIANNVRGLVLDNVSVEARDGNAMHFVNVK